MTTVADVVQNVAERLTAAGIDDARLEAEVLVAAATGSGRARLLASRNAAVDGDAMEAIEALSARRLAREPLSYIIGAREFYGAEILCDRRALIPRPETEMLVDIALEEATRGYQPRIADVGTGTGCIAVAVAASNAGAEVVAVDASRRALNLAATNIAAMGLHGRVHLVQTDLLRGLGRFDLILANLPYVPETDWERLMPEVRDWEPRGALVGGPDGTEAIAALMAMAPMHVSPDGVVALEIGYGQASRVGELARTAFPGATIEVRRDLAGIERVVVIRTQREGSPHD